MTTFVHYFIALDWSYFNHNFIFILSFVTWRACIIVALVLAFLQRIQPTTPSSIEVPTLFLKSTCNFVEVRQEEFTTLLHKKGLKEGVGYGKGAIIVVHCYHYHYNNGKMQVNIFSHHGVWKFRNVETKRIFFFRMNIKGNYLRLIPIPHLFFALPPCVFTPFHCT